MLKIAVVDDEVRQCRGLKNIILRKHDDWEVQAFISAAEALAYIQEESVKVIITDICMPEMDGLLLTELIRRSDSTAKIILLTGHAEFEYAQKAISLGAFDYLLKPLDPDRLWSVLDRAIEEVCREEILSRQHERLQQQLDMTLPVYMEKLLNQWVYGWASREERAEVEKIIPQGEAGFVIATYLPGWKAWRAVVQKEEADELRNQMIWWMRAQITKPWHSISFFSNILQDILVTVVTCKDTAIFQSDKREALQRLVTQLERNCSEAPILPGREPAAYVMGIGRFESLLLHHIEESYKSAVNVLPYRFYFPKSHLLRADMILPRRVGVVGISLAEEELLREAVRAGDKENALKTFGAILDRCQSGGYPDPDELKDCCKGVLERVASSLHFEQEIFTKANQEQEVTYEDFWKEAEAYLCAMADMVQRGRNSKNAAFAGRFAIFLEQHYSEDISLDDIAEIFRLTPAYCSAMIKEYTGNSFSRSLIAVRVTKAKQLLADKDLKIYEIAVMTGFRDVKYFNRVFKKETGLTPIEYRNGVLKIREELDE